MKITMNEQKAEKIYWLTKFKVTVESAQKLLNENFIEGDDKLFEVELLIKKAKAYYNPLDEMIKGDRLLHTVAGTETTFTVTHKTKKRMTLRRDRIDGDGLPEYNPNGYEVHLSKRNTNEWMVLGNHYHGGLWEPYSED